MSSGGAKKSGVQLLKQVENEDLSLLLKSIHELEIRTNASEDNQAPAPHTFFGVPELDSLLLGTYPPILELICPPPATHASGAGKTSLLYLVIAHAILPTLFLSSQPLGGQDAAIILFDPLDHFRVPRLASIMLGLLKFRLQDAGHELNQRVKHEMKSLVKRCLLHVHIFRPQSWASLLVTLRALPDYLFDKDRHKSIHRRIHSIILDDIDAFVWSTRNSATSMMHNAAPQLTASARLTNSLQRLSTLLSSAVILVSSSNLSTVFRPPLYVSWNQAEQVMRLVVRRVEVLKFAPAISIDEAMADSQQRWQVLSRGRFECWMAGSMSNGEGFVFKVEQRAVEVERTD